MRAIRKEGRRLENRREAKEETGRNDACLRERERERERNDEDGKGETREWTRGTRESERLVKGWRRVESERESERETGCCGKEDEAETYIFRGANETAQCGGTGCSRPSPTRSPDLGAKYSAASGYTEWETKVARPSGALHRLSCSRAFASERTESWLSVSWITTRVSCSRRAVRCFSCSLAFLFLHTPIRISRDWRSRSCTYRRYARANRRSVTSWRCTIPARWWMVPSLTQGQWHFDART